MSGITLIASVHIDIAPWADIPPKLLVRFVPSPPKHASFNQVGISFYYNAVLFMVIYLDSTVTGHNEARTHLVGGRVVCI